MKRTDSFFGRILASPLLWGGLMSLGFYAAVHRGPLDHPLVLRYFAGHEVEYITTVMFFVALAVLGIKFLKIRFQKAALRQSPVLGGREAEKVDARYVDRYLDRLGQFEKKFGSSILTGRLRVALQFIRRCGSADELDTELRYLSEEDAAKADSDYGLVRLVLWAVPMLGFLGTVVGITMALGGLDLNAINESSKILSAGLSVAFDTTALAIALDVVLYFIQFLVYREESNLLWEVDKLTDDELRGRFELEGGGTDGGQIVAVRRMLESVVGSLEQLMDRQSKIWEQSMAVANQRYNQLTEQNAEMMKKSLSAALSENVALHARTLAQAESQLLEKSRETTIQLDETLRQNVAALSTLQQGTVRQAEAIQGVIGANGQLVRLEERLHENLSALAQVGNFEETVNSLAAVIHLLNGKHFNELRGEFRRPESGPDKNNKGKGSAA